MSEEDGMDMTGRFGVYDTKDNCWLFLIVKMCLIQQQLMAVINTVEMLSDKIEHESLMTAFEDIRAGRVRSLDEIDAELEKQ